MLPSKSLKGKKTTAEKQNTYYFGSTSSYFWDFFYPCRVLYILLQINWGKISDILNISCAYTGGYDTYTIRYLL